MRHGQNSLSGGSIEIIERLYSVLIQERATRLCMRSFDHTSDAVTGGDHGWPPDLRLDSAGHLRRRGRGAPLLRRAPSQHGSDSKHGWGRFGVVIRRI